MVEGHRFPQEFFGHAKMYLEKWESKHILMMWCAICFHYVYAVPKRERRITNLFWYCIYEANGVKFLVWHTWCQYPKERIWR